MTQSVDEMFKAAPSTIDNLVNPETALSEEPNQAPFNTHFGTQLSLFEWYELPENKHRLERFGLAMDAGRNVMPPDLIMRGMRSKYIICASSEWISFEGFDWSSLKVKVLVDVGGGIGSTSAVINEHLPDLKIFVQDRQLVIEDAKRVTKNILNLMP